MAYSGHRPTKTETVNHNIVKKGLLIHLQSQYTSIVAGLAAPLITTIVHSD